MRPDASRAERTTSFDVADFPQPHGREEEWRFTPLAVLGTLLDDAPATTRLELITEVPAEVRVTELGSEQVRAAGMMPPADRPAALAARNSAGALELSIPADAELAEPLRLRFTGSSAESSAAHVVIRAGRHSRAVVILEHSGSARHTELVSVLAEDGSDLRVVSVQEWADDAVHLAQHDAVVGRDARYRHVSVTLGGKLVRLNTNVRYAGPGGDAELLGVYFADAGQHLENRTFIDHDAPSCRSNVVYKGALQGETARTVWVGDVLIRAVAEGTETYELNRNLVLTDGARADSVPNLEIETGQIAGAGHASATGRFDDEQLFYLMARGIDEHTARRLVVRGFFADIINQIGIAEIEEKLMDAIDTELSLSMGTSTGEATTTTTVEEN